MRFARDNKNKSFHKMRRIREPIHVSLIVPTVQHYTKTYTPLKGSKAGPASRTGDL